MDTVQLGKALVPKGRLSEFTGKKKTMADIEEEMRLPPSETELVERRIRALEEQVAALRRLIILGQSSATATHMRRLQIRDEQSQKIERIEKVYFRHYRGVVVSLNTLMSTIRTRTVSDARMVLFCSIVKAEPDIAYSAIAARYGKHNAAIHHAVIRIEQCSPEIQQNVDEIVEAYRSTQETGNARQR